MLLGGVSHQNNIKSNTESDAMSSNASILKQLNKLERQTNKCRKSQRTKLNNFINQYKKLDGIVNKALKQKYLDTEM